MGRGAWIAGARAALLAGALGLPGCASAPPLTGLIHPDRQARDEAAASARARALSEAAQAAIDRHDEPAALGFLGQLVALEPRSAEAHHRLGKVYQALGRPAEAEAAFRKALSLDKEYVAAMTGLGSIEAARGRPREALARFDQAIEIDPRQAEAHLGRGRALEALGRPADALAAYFRALEFDPNSPEARLRTAALQIARHEPDQALARLDPLVEQNPDDAEARHQRGLAHLALGHAAAAVDDLTAASARLADRPDVFYHLALALNAARSPRAARVAADRAVQLAPGDTAARALSEKLRR